jgi:natural product biosynthesis luciferase-like monooxygenase protein
MHFSVMFFSSLALGQGAGAYNLLLDVARLADSGNFAGIWTPERHFHTFGGLFPNPAITSAALATITDRIQLRAGSLISPLHHTIRIAEDWSMIDNLSNGRVAVSFGTGWNVNDFIFYPERFSTRYQLMYDQIDAVQRLWKGERLIFKNTYDKDIEVELFPRPVQGELPIWITSSGKASTFVEAGTRQANLLTHLAGQNLKQLGEKIAQYRIAKEKGDDGSKPGVVSLLVHTFLDETVDAATSKARPALRSYLKSAIELEYRAAAGGGPVSGGRRAPVGFDASSLTDELLDLTVDRYLNGQSLIGTPDSVLPFIDEFKRAGVDELACLIDFGIDDGETIRSLQRLSGLASRF